MRAFLGLLLVACGACSGATEADEPAIIRLDPEPDAVEHLEWAIDRWEQAGVRPLIEFAAGGAPVTVVDEKPLNDQGERVDGGTALSGEDAYRVESVTIWRHARRRTWLHEVGHAFGVADHIDCDPDLSQTATRPVMCENGSGWRLDAASLQLICDVAGCDFFAPDP